MSDQRVMPERVGRAEAVGDLVYLTFGGSFLGLAMFLLGNMVHGFLVTLLYFLGGLWVIAVFRSRRAATWAVLAWIALFFLGNIAGAGIGLLASAGIWDDHAVAQTLFNISQWIAFIVLWMLMGVPHRAYVQRLDVNGDKHVQDFVLSLLVRTACILTGVYVLLFHFAAGPLSEVPLTPLLVGIVFTTTMLAPFYRSVVTTVWSGGVQSVASSVLFRGKWRIARVELHRVITENAEQLVAERRESRALAARASVAENNDDIEVDPSEPTRAQRSPDNQYVIAKRPLGGAQRGKKRPSSRKKGSG